MNTERKTELLVGFFLLVGLLTLAAIILQFGKIKDYFQNRYVIYVQFPDATGIRTGTPVALGGQRIGKVKSEPQLDRKTFESVVVELEIFEQYKVPPSSRYEIASAGLMGDSYIAIRPNKAPPEVIQDDAGRDVIKGSASSGLNALQESAGEIAKKVDEMVLTLHEAIKELKTGLQRINEGALNDTTLGDFRNSMQHLEKSMAKVDEGFLNQENEDNIKQALADLRVAAASFKSASGTVDQSLKQVEPLVTKLGNAADKVEKTLGTAEAALLSFKQSGDNLAVFTKDMAKGQGLFRALIMDEKLKQDFKDLIYNLKEHGPLIYRDTAEKDRGKAGQQPASPPTPPRSPLLRPGR